LWNTHHSLEFCLFPVQVCRNLLDAVISGDVKTVKRLVNCTHGNCTTDDYNRHTPLTSAARYDHVEVVRLLLEGGANVESVNANRSTALHNAAWNGRLDVCRLLLDWGAKVDPVNEWEDTPLHGAAFRGYLKVVKLLVERGADVSLRNKFGKTASDVARDWGKEDVAHWLDTVSRD